MDINPSSTPHLYTLLERHLSALLGDVDAEVIDLLRQHLEWVEIAGGETLMRQGESGDSMYLAISGRLRVYVTDSDGTVRMVREITRGQIVGEMSLYTDEPRLATVVAIRDSVMVRLPKTEFIRMLATSAQVSLALTRQIIRRLQGDTQQPMIDKPVIIGLLPVTAGVDLPDFAARLAAQLSKMARVRIVDADVIDRELGQPGMANDSVSDAGTNRRIALLLDTIEAENDYVLLLADTALPAWAQRCCSHSDELLLLADATQPVALHPLEQQFLMQRPAQAGVAEVLVLLHPAEQKMPRGTAAWLARRPVAGHLHLRPALDRDMARLARLQSRTAVGLVLAGGGARGIAHLGILKVLEERGIEVDCVGGTSIGAVMAVYAASDQPVDTVLANARRAFSANPMADLNLLPLLSLFKGVRLRRVVARAAESLMGFDADLEDLWKTYFCVTTNYSRAAEQVISHGNLVTGLLASTAIPGALPPVIRDSELLFDGGSFNNFPVDVMRNLRGVGRVIGVDLSHRNVHRITHDEVPGTWALLRDRLRPRNRRRYRLPSLPGYLMNVSVLYGVSRQRNAERMTDMYFNPPLLRIGMLDWHKFEKILRLGYAHATEVMEKLGAAVSKGEEPQTVGEG